ncbi:MAG: 5'/3'-nucleotidase SurE [Desulfofustis sp.]|jgi:5'-nucleotidase
MHTILLTNDDGIHSPGLKALKESLSALGKIVIVAPDRDNSAIAHALTMHRPLRLTELDEDVYTLDGTPTDCVAVALGKIFERAPDLLVSGINSGPNIGDDITYSGTVSAAIEGTMYAVPSMAVSMAGEPPLDYGKAELLIRQLAQRVIAHGLPASTLMNVNIPAASELRGVKITRQGRRIWKQAVQEVADPRGRMHYWIGGGTPLLDSGKDTDVWALGEGFVTISPIHLDLTNHEGISYFRDDLQLEKLLGDAESS